ncbi:glycosyltransferase family protein [Wenxinia marina]|uniref:glycosyltransferase family protein n=1 Tax=Wenxinia marina TaxID=390641 RepID=UPI00037469F3|nr:glycosyltransferase [Wenxinia marina]
MIPVGRTGRALVDPVPRGDVRLTRPGHAPVDIQVSGWSGRVETVEGALVTGWARNDRHPGRPATVLALGAEGVVAHASAGADGRFALRLPGALVRSAAAHVITLAIAGSDHLIEDGRIAVGGVPGAARPRPAGRPTVRLTARPAASRAIRIKISTPNLKEAPMWGDYHFARSLAAAFERLDLQAGVDCRDAWYGRTVDEDVVLAIRGRERLTLDRGRINVMWLISHPDRIEDDEFAEYDHVAVASDVYGRALAARGLTETSVLHQATDAHLFGAAGAAAQDGERRAACLFVGNSRREYRTMVKWCRQRGIPLDLYGGGWEGILPAEAVAAPSVSNAELPALYARHLLLLNDHWDSMRDNGFLSNRLFDGSATGTPILTDPVAGLAEVFGDTIATADTAESFAARARDALADPGPWLGRAARAREIVLGAHTFDHRAASLAALFERLALRKGIA